MEPGLLRRLEQRQRLYLAAHRGSIPYTYDAADNLTKKGTVFQAFNNADELSGLRQPPSGKTTYQYDTRATGPASRPVSARRRPCPTTRPTG